MSPTPVNEPAKRRRTRRAEPDGAGHLARPRRRGPGPPRPRGGATPEAAAAAAPPEPDAVPEEPEWLRERPVEPELAAAGPALDPEAVAAAIEARRAARAEEIVSRLNPEQARAVTTTEGPLLILAGAGSGKTRVIAHRIAYLIGVKAVPPRRILAVTFTNRAAGELRERITALVGEPGKDVQAGTFHALCARVLRRDGEAIGLDRRFVIYDTDDQQQLMKRILAEEDLPATGEFRPAAILGAISRAKNEMLDETFLAEHAVNHRERIIARLAGRYRERLRAANALDFDDLLLRGGRPVRAVARGARHATTRAGATSTSTSTRTRTGRSTCGSGRSRRRTATCAWSGTTTSRSTAGAARTSRTSSTSSATTPRRRWSSSSRTTARRS